MSNRRVRSNLTPLALAIAGIVCTAAAAAQEAPAAVNGETGDRIQEGIATAQRTSSAESKTPVAMSVLDGAPLGSPWSVLLRVKDLQNKVKPVTIDSFGMTVPGEARAVALRVDYGS